MTAHKAAHTDVPHKETGEQVPTQRSGMTIVCEVLIVEDRDEQRFGGFMELNDERITAEGKTIGGMLHRLAEKCADVEQGTKTGR